MVTVFDTLVREFVVRLFLVSAQQSQLLEVRS